MTTLQGDALDLAPDPVLQAIAADAVKATRASWSALTLLLRHTVIYRAHRNLPHELSNMFSSESAGSLCQLVVTTGRPVNVEDSERAGKQGPYRGRAFLVMPVSIDGVRVGALCVHDSQPRVFDDRHSAELTALAQLASQRLAVLAYRRAPSRRLVDFAMRPAFAELRNELTPLEADLVFAQETLRKLAGEAADARAKASSSIDRMMQALAGLQRTTRRISDNLGSLQVLCCGEERAVVSEVVNASDELAYHHTQMIGGVFWSVGAPTATLDVSQRTSVSVITASLSMLALRLGSTPDRTGISVEVGKGPGQVLFRMCANLESGALRECATALADLLDTNQIEVKAEPGAYQIAFPAA